MIVKTIGRSQENDIVINDGLVSRVHLQMIHDDNGNISVVDLNSANGTFVNGSRIVNETRLNPDDELRIGNTVLNWHEYFREVRPTKPAIPLAHPNIPHPPKRNPTWMYIAGGVLAALLIGGGIFLLINNSNKKPELENIKQEQTEEKHIKGDLGNAEVDKVVKAKMDLKDAMIEEEKAKREVVEAQREAEKKAAEEAKQQAAENMEKAVKQAEEKARAEAMEKAKKEREEAVRIAEEQARREAAEKADKEKEKAVKEATEKALEKARTEAQEKEFDELIAKVTSNKKLKAICKELGLPEAPKNEEMSKNINKHFNDTQGIEARNKIINIIKKQLH